MKRFLAIVLMAMIMCSVANAFASERLQEYESALTNDTWKPVAYGFVNDKSGIYTMFFQVIPEIRLPNDAIKLFERPSGDILLTAVDGEVMCIADIIFDDKMSSFVLYSSDGAALLFQKNNDS